MYKTSTMKNELYIVYRDYNNPQSPDTYVNRWSRCILNTDGYNNGIEKLTSRLIENKGNMTKINIVNMPLDVLELFDFFKDSDYFVINDATNNCHYTLQMTRDVRDAYYFGNVAESFLRRLKVTRTITIK